MGLNLNILENFDLARLGHYSESPQALQVLAAVRGRGIAVEDIGAFNYHTGSMQIVWRDAKTGQLHGVTDPRRLGLAAGY